jgi:CheY-like chemotaxis protein
MRKSPVVLVVDDEPIVREALVNLFDQAGCRVLDAFNGTDALKMLESQPEISLLIADVQMAGMTGTQLAAEARRRRADLRIVLTSGKPKGPSNDNFLFISKPWRAADIHMILGDLLQYG